jgi:ABC-type uncharacterized transport system ATPase subunit
VLTIGDRIAVIHGGRLSEAMPRGQADVTEIGLMMAGVTQPPQRLEARPS